LDFSLTALFVVLAVEQYKKKRKASPFVIGIAASVLSMLLVPANRMLFVSIGMALLTMFLFRKKFENERS